MKKRGRAKKKLILGLTGSYGSGKSTVAGLFKPYGAKVIDADKIAHRLIRPGTLVYKKIISVFGRNILKADRTVDRDKLSGIVFNNRRMLKELNSIVHPAVIKVIDKEINACTEKVIIIDAPLLIEAGLHKITNKLIVVKITKERQIERIHKKTGLSRLDILKRIRSQIPLKIKVRIADFVIDNSLTIRETKKQVQEIRRLLWKN